MFDYAAHQLREIAESIRPAFRNGRPEHLDMPDDAPDQLESAAAFLKAAGELTPYDIAKMKLGMDPYLPSNKRVLDFIALIEALPEVKP